jgi:PAS domain-containing protein
MAIKTLKSGATDLRVEACSWQPGAGGEARIEPGGGSSCGASRPRRNYGGSRRGRHAILDAAVDAIITIDHEGKIQAWNRAAEEMFGYKPLK